MKLSRTVTYALQATLLLARAQPGEPVPCSRLAAEGAMPERFLLQILRSLVTHGILQSTRGVDGGYTLDRSPEEISLLEIIEAVDGPMNTKLPFAEGMTGESEVRLREALYSIASSARQQLQEVKVAHLINPQNLEKQLTS
jgi:Rrf2 family protein